MAVGKDELSSSFPHQALAARKAFRSELDGSKAEWASNRYDPLGKEGERQRMGGGDAQRLNWHSRPGSRVGARLIDLAAQCLRPGQQSPSRLGQRHGARATLEQRGSGPLLQCPDAAAESRLRNVAVSGRARKAAAFCQGHEIGKPVQVHVVFGIGR